MATLIINFFFVLSLFAILSNCCELFWSSRQSLGYGQGVQLQVCCNVSKVEIWSLGNAANFSVGSLVFEREFQNTDEDVFTELQLSICSDRSEPTIGWVGAKPGVTCTYRKGDTVDILPTSFDLPGWYIICYIMADGCKTCSLEAVCDNELSNACANLHVIGSSPTATNSSIDYWVKTGVHYPFEKSSRIELTIKNQRTKEVLTSKSVQPKKNIKSTLTFDDLLPNHVYNVERCLIVSLPPSLMNDPRFDFSSPTNKLCVEEGFRTERNTARSTVSIFFVCVSLISLSFF